MERTMTLHVKGRTLQVYPDDQLDQVLYGIEENGALLTVIGLNEDAQWEASTDIDSDFIRSVGDAIEQHLL